MRDIHLNRKLLRAIAKGEVEPRVLVKVGLEHLRCICPTCAAEWDAWEAEKRSQYLESRLPGFLTEQLKRIEAAERGANEDFRTLMELEPERRLSRVVRARKGFRSAALVRLLLAESRRTVPLDHDCAYDLADLAFHVAERLTGSDLTQGLVPLALAEMANALRVKPDARGARELLDRSRALIQIGGISDPSIVARIDHLEASLSLNLRRFAEAEKLLDRAKILYGLVGAMSEVAKVEITRALLFLEASEPLRALKVTRETLATEAVSEDRKLYLWARINLARACCDLKDLRAAKRILEQDEPQHAEMGEPLAHLRYPWIRGRVAMAERDFGLARKKFQVVRDGFVEARMGYDAALVSLDLALVALQQGQSEAVRELAQEMLPTFTSQDVHREALAALKLFTDAAQQEVLTEALIEDLRAYLLDARCQPELRFQPGAGAGN